MEAKLDLIEPILAKSIEKILIENGSAYLEHKFISIQNNLRASHKIQATPIELYSIIIPGLIPTWTLTTKVFENTFSENDCFVPLFDESEKCFRNWVKNFYLTSFVFKMENKFYVHRSNCENQLKTYNEWTTNYKELSGSIIRKNLNWDLGDFPENQRLIYEPKSTYIRNEILLQLNKFGKLQITSSKQIIQIQLENSKMIVCKTERYLIDPIILRNWFINFGIELSLVTTTYLIENGIHYCGRQIGMIDMMTNSIGIFKILADELRSLIALSEDLPYEISRKNHPLKQSVVLALARLENYLHS